MVVICDICDKELKDNWNLKRHKARDHGIGLLPCTIQGCSHNFATQAQLDSHLVKLATGGKITAQPVYNKNGNGWTCEHCSENFDRISLYKKHVRIHTGEKPFVCEFCEHGFRRKEDLTRHAVIHTEDRPYVCQVCSSSFNLRQSLVVHLRVHKDEPNYCGICDEVLEGISKQDHEAGIIHRRMLEILQKVALDESKAPDAFPPSAPKGLFKFELKISTDQTGVKRKDGHHILRNLKQLDFYRDVNGKEVKCHEAPSYGMHNVNYMQWCENETCRDLPPRSGIASDLCCRMNFHLMEMERDVPKSAVGQHFHKTGPCFNSMAVAVIRQAEAPKDAATAPKAFRTLYKQVQLDIGEILDHKNKGWDPYTAKKDVNELNKERPGERVHKIVPLPIWKDGILKGLADKTIRIRNALAGEDEDDNVATSSTVPSKRTSSTATSSNAAKKSKRNNDNVDIDPEDLFEF